MEIIPSLGLGTWKIPKEIAEDIVYQAITIGNTYIKTFIFIFIYS